MDISKKVVVSSRSLGCTTMSVMSRYPVCVFAILFV